MKQLSSAANLVLLGAGHAHVEVLRRLARRPQSGVRITLVTREPHTPYSGMLPGLIRGEYGDEEAHIDCARLAAGAAARLVLAEADALDPAATRVRLAGGPSLDYDLLSIDVGGVSAMPASGGIAVKPIGQFLLQLEQLETTLSTAATIAVVGGGAGGCELAVALALRLRRRARIVLVSRALLPGVPDRVRHVVRARLDALGVELRCGVAASGHADGRLLLSGGESLRAAVALWATGVIAPTFLAASGLACDVDGCVLVDPTLRSTSHPAVFAAGDCATIAGATRPKSGVWAVRAGRPLAANLRRAATGRTLRAWRPQREALAILGLGEGRAVAWRNGLAYEGRLAWWWKDRIDRHWIGRYHRMP